MTGPIDVVLPPDERYTREGGGAVASVTRGLARELVADGVRVRVLTPRSAGTPFDVPEVVALRFRLPRTRRERAVAKAGRLLGRVGRAVGREPGDSAARYARAVLDAVAAGPATEVVVHNEPALAADLVRRLPGRTVVLWLHNLLVGGQGADLAALPPGVRVVCVSHAVADWTAETYGLPPERLTVIHNGVDLRAFHPPVDRDGRDAAHALRVACHGRIDPNKGQVLAARAVAALRAEGHPVDLTVIGAVRTFGLAQDVVRSFTAELDDAVAAAGARITGWVPGAEVPDLLRTFDVALILPAAPDPFPLAGLEAMATGCAVVAVPLGGVAEMVGDAAIRVGPTVPEVADALRRLLLEPGLLEERQAASRARAEQFGWAVAARRLRTLLDG